MHVLDLCLAHVGPFSQGMLAPPKEDNSAAYITLGENDPSCVADTHALHTGVDM